MLYNALLFCLNVTICWGLHILLDVTLGPAGEIFSVLVVCEHIANGYCILCINTCYLTARCQRGGDCKGLQNKPCFIHIGDWRVWVLESLDGLKYWWEKGELFCLWLTRVITSSLSNWVAYRLGEEWTAVRTEELLLLLILNQVQNKSFASSAKTCSLTNTI